MIRFAKPSDGREAIELVMIVLRDMELDIFNKLPEERVIDLLVEAFETEPDYRYGYNNALIKEINGEVAGVAFGYPDHWEEVIDEPFIQLLEKNGLSRDHRLFTEAEVFEGEWYLDTLVTSQKFRGQGVATELLDALPTQAKKHNLTKLGLNCDQGNDGARNVYINNGLEKVGEIDIANHRYDHLQKEVI